MGSIKKYGKYNSPEVDLDKTTDYMKSILDKYGTGQYLAYTKAKVNEDAETFGILAKENNKGRANVINLKAQDYENETLPISAILSDTDATLVSPLKVGNFYETVFGGRIKKCYEITKNINPNNEETIVNSLSASSDEGIVCGLTLADSPERNSNEKVTVIVTDYPNSEQNETSKLLTIINNCNNKENVEIIFVSESAINTDKKIAYQNYRNSFYEDKENNDSLVEYLSKSGIKCTAIEFTGNTDVNVHGNICGNAAEYIGLDSYVKDGTWKIKENIVMTDSKGKIRENFGVRVIIWDEEGNETIIESDSGTLEEINDFLNGKVEIEGLYDNISGDLFAGIKKDENDDSILSANFSAITNAVDSILKSTGMETNITKAVLQNEATATNSLSGYLNGVLVLNDILYSKIGYDNGNLINNFLDINSEIDKALSNETNDLLAAIGYSTNSSAKTFNKLCKDYYNDESIDTGLFTLNFGDGNNFGNISKSDLDSLLTNTKETISSAKEHNESVRNSLQELYDLQNNKNVSGDSWSELLKFTNIYMNLLDESDEAMNMLETVMEESKKRINDYIGEYEFLDSNRKPLLQEEITKAKNEIERLTNLINETETKVFTRKDGQKVTIVVRKYSGSQITEWGNIINEQKVVIEECNKEIDKIDGFPDVLKEVEENMNAALKCVQRNYGENISKVKSGTIAEYRTFFSRNSNINWYVGEASVNVGSSNITYDANKYSYKTYDKTVKKQLESVKTNALKGNISTEEANTPIIQIEKGTETDTSKQDIIHIASPSEYLKNLSKEIEDNNNNDITVKEQPTWLEKIKEIFIK